MDYLPVRRGSAQSRSTRATRPNNFAVVVIDMYEDFRTNMYCAAETRDRHNTDSVVRLIREARAMCLPIFFFREPGYQIMPQFVDACGEMPLVLEKKSLSSFGPLFTDVSFEHMLTTLGVDALVMAGFNMNCCVRFTAEDALKKGYLILTAQELLFGTNAIKDSHILEAMLLFYQLKTEYYFRLEELLAAIRSRSHVCCNSIGPTPSLEVVA